MIYWLSLMMVSTLGFAQARYCSLEQLSRPLTSPMVCFLSKTAPWLQVGLENGELAVGSKSISDDLFKTSFDTFLKESEKTIQLEWEKVKNRDNYRLSPTQILISFTADSTIPYEVAAVAIASPKGRVVKPAKLEFTFAQRLDHAPDNKEKADFKIAAKEKFEAFIKWTGKDKKRFAEPAELEVVNALDVEWTVSMTLRLKN